jgi:hypothetical protein
LFFKSQEKRRQLALISLSLFTVFFRFYLGGEESGGGGFVVVDDPDRRLALRSYWTRKG